MAILLAQRVDRCGTLILKHPVSCFQYDVWFIKTYYFVAFQVTSLPEVPFNIGELYSGSMPINSADSSRELFFVFQPTIGNPVDEVTIWLNGGPGCSSLNGFFEENGLWVWEPGAAAPTFNEYAWVNLTNMLW
jgi:carboxypeptidase D